MKLDSKYFDSIRVGSKRAARAEAAREKRQTRCQWKGCKEPGGHKAPQGRGKDGQYYSFCMEHVRQYNATYNYFDGMNDTEVEDFQKDAMTGHRPTWKVGVNASAAGATPVRDGASASVDPAATTGFRTMDPHGFFARRARAREQSVEGRRQVKPLEKKNLQVLNLSGEASREEIKTRFKELVKIYHPDANGGDARSGEKLREIIQAYNFLKQAGLA
jgi:hypothetical protein